MPRLAACSRSTPTAGEPLAEYKLPAPRVWDGLAPASAKLLVSLIDGKVLCLRGTG